MKKPKEPIIVPITLHTLMILMENLSGDLFEAQLEKHPNDALRERFADQSVSVGAQVLELLMDAYPDNANMALATLIQLAVGLMQQSPACTQSKEFSHSVAVCHPKTSTVIN